MNPIIPVFISSPSDVPEERKITEEAIHDISERLSNRLGIVLIPVSWREFAPLSSDENQPPQDMIIRRLEPSTIFVGILFRRYGSAVQGKDVSGTEAEFDYALQNRKRVRILTYFRDQDRKNIPNLDDEMIRQLNEVNSFKDRLRSKNVFYHDYETEEEFSRRIVLDLMDTVLQIVLAPDPRLSVYRRFFKSGGEIEGKQDQSLVIYPPITSIRLSKEKSGVNWRHHLLPTVVYEDVKAVQKIEAVLRLLNRPFLTVTTPWPVISITDRGDRFWVCVPRNAAALHTLENLGDRVRFRYPSSYGPESSIEDRHLIWKSKEGKEFKIASPLIQYLKLTKRPTKKVSWNPEFGYTYARDFAIIARFAVRSGNTLFYHYFFGGLRGLGTWGAAWFIDHCTDELDKAISSSGDSSRPHADIQLLVEVEYLNYKIWGVKDVTDYSQDYFDHASSSEHVKQMFDTFTASDPPYVP
jgi:hypothetical protein